jgi:hypothetical protein
MYFSDCGSFVRQVDRVHADAEVRDDLELGQGVHQLAVDRHRSERRQAAHARSALL